MTYLSLRALRTACMVTMQVSIVTLSIYILGVIGNSESSQPARWPQLATMMLVGLAGQRLLQRVPARLRTITWLGVAIVPLMLLLKSLVGGGLHPTQGWEYVFETRLRNFQELVFGIVGLILVLRRAITLPALSPFELAGLFRRQVIVLSIVLLGCVYFFQASLGGPVVQSTLIRYVFIFMTSALLTIVLGQIPRQEQAAKQGQMIVSSMFPILAILLLGLAGAAAFFGSARGLLLLLLEGLVQLLLVPLIILGLISGGIADAILPDEIDPLVVDITIQSNAKIGAGLTPAEQAQIAADPLTFWVNLFSYALTLSLLVGLGLVVLRWLRPATQASDELIERSAVWSWQDLRQSLSDLVARLWPQPRHDHLGALAPSDPIRRIRHAYRSLLVLAADHQHQRKSYQTPREFIVDAQPIALAADAELAHLTALYEIARYGPPPSPEQAQAAEDALRAISAAASSQEELPPQLV